MATRIIAIYHVKDSADRIAARAVDHEAGFAQLGGARRAYEEGHVSACGGEPAAEVATERACTHDQNAHVFFLESNERRPC